MTSSDAQPEAPDPASRAGRSSARGLLRPARAEDRDQAGLELIGKVSAVLAELEREKQATAMELATAIGEPLSSVYRLLQSLSVVGWVERAPRRGAYRLGLAHLTIGGLVEDRLDVREAALPSLRELVETIGVTSFLCVRRGSRAVCLERLEGFAVQSLAMQLGGSLPLYAGAAPRALLAFLPPAELASVLLPTTDQMLGDPPRPESSALAEDIDRIKADGFAISDQDVTPGVAALGAPVFNHRGEVEGALSISGLRAQILGDKLEVNARLVMDASRAASTALGFEPR